MTSSGALNLTTIWRNLYCKMWNAVRVCNAHHATQMPDSIVTFEIVTFENAIFRTPCRLKIVVRLLMWIIRRRHRYAVKRWFREKRMVDMGKDLGLFWLDHLDRDENFPGRRYFLACRFNPMLLTSTTLGEIDPNPNSVANLKLKNRSREKEAVELHRMKTEEPFSWIANAVLERNPKATNDNPNPTLVIGKAEVLGNVPFAEVHQDFRGLDGDRMEPLDRFFSIPRFLDQYCRAWSFISGRKIKQVEGLGKNLRNLSVRRHPIRALQSGPL